MTAVDVDALDKLREAATAGPWFAWNRGVGWHIAVEDPQGVDHLPGRPELLPEGMRTDLARAEDAALIVTAVNALPKLLAEVRRGRALREAVEGLAVGAASAADLPVLKGDRFDAGVAATYRSVADRIRAVLAAGDPS